MILIRANTERQIPVIRATLVSAPPSECLEIRLCLRVANGTVSGWCVQIMGHTLAFTLPARNDAESPTYPCHKML